MGLGFCRVRVLGENWVLRGGDDEGRRGEGGSEKLRRSSIFFFFFSFPGFESSLSYPFGLVMEEERVLEGFIFV